MRLLVLALLTLNLAIANTAFSAPEEAPKAALSGAALSSQRLNEDGIVALRQRDYPTAEEKFKKSLDMDEQNVTAAYNLAGVLVTEQRAGEAIKLLQKYAELAPKDAGIQARLGDAYFSTKEIKKAVTAYESALKLDPFYLKIYEKLGTCLTLLRNTKEAEIAFARAHQAFPNDSVILNNLAAVQLANGHAAMAVQSAESSINLKPSAEAYATLSAAQDKLGNKEAAVAAYKKSKAIGAAKK